MNFSKVRNPIYHISRYLAALVISLNNGKTDVGKFDEKSDKGIFLGYAFNARAYRVFNKRTLVVEESLHVIFDESNFKLTLLDDFNVDITEKEESSPEKLKSL